MRQDELSFESLLDSVRNKNLDPYYTFTLDLSIARDNILLPISGGVIQVVDETSRSMTATCSISLDSQHKKIPFYLGTRLVSPFTKLWFSNTAQAGKRFTLAIATEKENIFDLSFFLNNPDTIHIHSIQVFGDMRGIFTVSPDWIILNLTPETFPLGITITKITVDCSIALPVTELKGTIKYCDALGGGAFPSGSPTNIQVIDTTSGNFSSGAILALVDSTKIVYLELSSDPTDYNTTWCITLNFTIN